ncbi:GH1 family beta-glucosidase [Microbacterium sp. cx-59]|uniref:GH1 family beta-glucosidase n=1 Tax=Microbacterium sp. cx-59 TaxID=2891207 RepID=UPI001E48FDF6|nr:GH1 family beta-glucosidase [Microbacterium sp. cx-59]MCC4908778.1 beta-glucosidase [Microbacterium sp. cx-59]
MHTTPHITVDLAAFPADFAWGVATAAYQIEGAATEGGRGPSIWDTFARTPGLTLHGDTGDIACDHYHRWESDLDLLASLGVTSYRLSVSWSRLQPDGRGALNPEAVAFYRQILEGLRSRGIGAYVTLYHWDLPDPLEREGGWTSRKVAYLFADYARAVLTQLSDLASHWITLNEPWCSSFLGYGYGAHAPGRKDLRAAVAAAHHLNLAHGLAVAAIREVAPAARVGVTDILTDIVAATDGDRDRAAAVRLDAVSNRVFMDPVYRGEYSRTVHEALDPLGLSEAIHDGDLAIISAPVDFAGVNHYQRVIASADDAMPFGVREVPAEPSTTSFGWSVTPDALRSVLARVAEEWTNLPVYVTESGASFHDYVDPSGEIVDTERVSYLDGYFAAAADAIADGVDLRGYFVWSFLDNFEWAEGYSKRFGIVYVDYRTQERIPKLSAHWYRDLIAAHASQTRPIPAVARR